MSDEAEQAAIDRAEEQYAEAQVQAQSSIAAAEPPFEEPNVAEAITAVEQAYQAQQRRPLTVEDMIVRAIDKGVSVETMERLLAMRRELKAELAKEAFDKSMAAFQRACPPIKKTKKVFEKNNPNKVRYAYAPLESIVEQTKELIARWGFSYSVDAQVEPIGDRSWVTALCKVTHSAGHSQVSQFKVPIDPDAYMNEAQKFASALTFSKRYAFISAFGIMTADEDDDSKTSGEPQEAPGRAAGPKPWDRGQKPPVGSPKPTVARPSATEAHKARLLEVLTENGDLATWSREFFEKVGAILPNESLEDVPLSHVPVTAEQKDALMRAIGEFGSGEEARLPYPLNLVTFRKEAEKAQPKNASTDPSDPNSPQAPWRSFPMPFGKSAGVKLADLDKKYLYGLWANFTVEKTYNGKPRPAEKIASDQRLRNYLNDAGVHYAFTKKD